ncbi:MAG: YlmH/Sll1252 family protein [Firmicutes bacterium]|nr:YlmH/Sll1252 family protein [Bacillota bacterium]
MSSDYSNAQTPEERLLLSKARDRLFLCQETSAPAFTDFLDPVRADKFARLLSKESGLCAEAFGGEAESERKIIGFSEEPLSWRDYPIDAVLLAFDKRRGPAHRDILGALTGLGLDRCKIGDIVLTEGKAKAYVCRGVSGFIRLNLAKAGRAPVEVSIEPVEDPARESEFVSRREEELLLTVASLRLDCVLGAAYQLSRGKVSELVRSGRVYVNWNEVSDGSKRVGENDVITVRGEGRLRIIGIGGETKSGRIKIVAVRNY